MSDNTNLVPAKTAMLIPRLAAQAGVEPDKFYAAIKSNCGCEGATDEAFAALLIVANKYRLDPILRQLYLMSTKRGIQTVIPVDGWVPLLVNHPDYLAHDVSLEWEGPRYKSKCLAATCRIWSKTRQAMGMGPFEHSELMAECGRDTGPWKSHPTRMLGHKAIIQAVRWCFGIYVMDEDEARNIGEVPKVKQHGYTLPTETPKTETVIDATSEPLTVEVGTKSGWLAMIGDTKGTESLVSLHEKFQEVRGQYSIADDEEIELAFVKKLGGAAV